MKRIEKEYQQEYGDISRNEITRFGELLDNINLSRKHRSEIFERINRNLNIPWRRIDYIIYLVPKATPRPRSNFNRRIFYVSGAKDNKDIFKNFAKSIEDLELITTPCKFTCISYFPIPNSMNNLEKILAELGLIRPISKPDFDNLAKTYSDMIQGTLLYDDALIVEGTSKKFYSTKPRIEVHIEYMSEMDSIYNEKKMKKKKEGNEYE